MKDWLIGTLVLSGLLLVFFTVLSAIDVAQNLEGYRFWVFMCAVAGLCAGAGFLGEWEERRRRERLLRNL